MNDKIGQENAHVGEGKKESGGVCVFYMCRVQKKKKESKKKTSGERRNARNIYIKKRNRERQRNERTNQGKCTKENTRTTKP